MSQTLTQFFSDKPRLEVATRNLTFNKKLRRLVAQAIDQLYETTSPRDLADKVLKQINTPQTLNFLFGDGRLKPVDRVSLVYSKLELPIKLCCETFTGIISRSTFETNLMWQKSYISTKHKTLCGNPDIFLAPQKDMNRVYVTNGSTEVAIVDSVSPMTFLDDDVKDRHKYAKPQLATFIKLNDESVLFLFLSKNDGLQRRFQIPYIRVKQFTFKTLDEGYQQDGLQVIPKDLSGKEFEVSALSEVVGEKRKGVIAPVWCFDQTSRGRQGDQGPQGRKGQQGDDRNKFGLSAQSLQIEVHKSGKRLVSNRDEFRCAQGGEKGWILPMKTELIRSWSR